MLRKFLRTLVCMLLVVSLLGMTAYAETGKVTGSDVNLRSGPGTGYRVVDTLPAGATVSGRVDVTLDFGFMYSQKYDMSASTNVFTITAVDKNGKTTTAQAKFKL